MRDGRRVGESGRAGQIHEVVGEPGHEHYRVHWEDEAQSVFYPPAARSSAAARTTVGDSRHEDHSRVVRFCLL